MLTEHASRNNCSLTPSGSLHAQRGAISDVPAALIERVERFGTQEDLG
jgi:hypothetical protein